MEATKTKLRARKPLSDCTNSKISTTISSQSSTSSFSSSIKKRRKSLLSSAIHKSLYYNVSADTDYSSGPSPTEYSEVSHTSSALRPPPASTPSRPLKSSSSSGLDDCVVREPQSYYSRRHTATAVKRKISAKEIDTSLNQSAALTIFNDGSAMRRHGLSGLPKACTVPHKKRCHLNTSRKDASQSALPQDFIEQQRAYFAEIDAFELPEEEVESVQELE